MHKLSSGIENASALDGSVTQISNRLAERSGNAGILPGKTEASAGESGMGKDDVPPEGPGMFIRGCIVLLIWGLLVVSCSIR